MRRLLPVLLIGLALLASCHKNDVDVADLTSNPFDADHPGVSTLFSMDTIHTEAYAQGVYNMQTVVVNVHPGQFPSPTAYTLRFIELTDPDTSYFYSTNEAGSNTFLCSNYQVALGTEYCYRFELLVEGEVVTAKERCAMAEL